VTTNPDMVVVRLNKICSIFYNLIFHTLPTLILVTQDSMVPTACHWLRYLPVDDADARTGQLCDRQSQAVADQSHRDWQDEGEDCVQVSAALFQHHVHIQSLHKPLAIDSRQCSCKTRHIYILHLYKLANSYVNT